MIKLAVVTAFVALLKVIAETYFPQFPISEELINSLIVALIGLLGGSVVEFTARNSIANWPRGLWK